MLAVIAIIAVAIAALVLYGDHVGVTIISVTPEASTTVSIDAAIQINFDQPMNQDSVRAHFVTEPKVEGAFRWTSGTLTFVPDPPLNPGQRYTFTIEAGAKAITGHRLKQDYQWTFFTRAPVAFYLSPANVVDRSLWAVSMTNTTPVEIYASADGILDFEPSPDSSMIAVTVYGEEELTADVWLINPDGSNPRQLTDCAPGACGRPVWSPDGRLIAYEYQARTEVGAIAPSRIWLVDVETGETAPVYEDNQVLGYWATWGPEGRVISFYDSNVTGIRIVNLETQDEIIIETQLPDAWSFARDGQSLLYSDLRQEDQRYLSQLWVARLSGDNVGRETFLDNPQEDQEAAWSPDGQWVAFRRRLLDGSQGLGWQLVLYNPTTGELRQATNDSGYTSRNIQWHPSGDLIVFQRYNLNVGYSAEIWAYQLSTNQLYLLATDAFNGKWLPYY
ncbi:MAG: Ig-like domain-containing protein [Anaerolineales bacterium]|nr:Ig-like domain-containing protein [Anaerolineales bacterium]